MHMRKCSPASSMAQFWKAQGPVVGHCPGVGTSVLNYSSSFVLSANLISNPSPSFHNLLIRMLKWISPKNRTLQPQFNALRNYDEYSLTTVLKTTAESANRRINWMTYLSAFLYVDTNYLTKPWVIYVFENFTNYFLIDYTLTMIDKMKLCLVSRTLCLGMLSNA